jgi:hypothetical protein
MSRVSWFKGLYIMLFLMPLLTSVQDFAFRGRLVNSSLRSCGVSPNSLFPQESSSCTPINRWISKYENLIF